MRSFRVLLFCAVLGIAVDCVRADQTSVTRIEVYPPQFTLSGKSARQKVLVSAFYSDGRVTDVTQRAKLETNPSILYVDPDGVVHPRTGGAAILKATFAGHDSKARVSSIRQGAPETWSFVNRVEPVLSKQGCNTGPCHGAAAGKGGFRLTLRAYDPELDYLRLTKEARGRRIVRSAPTESLLLKKPSLGAPHAGGLRLSRDSVEYRTLARWIASGAPGPNPAEPRIVGVEVYPKERMLQIGDEQQLLVTAHFSDGSREDATRWAKFGSGDEPVAKVNGSGLVSMLGAGETVISVWYAGKVAFARMAVPFHGPASTLAPSPRGNYVDDHVRRKLAKLRIPASQICTDSEFIRRVFLDTTGCLPTSRETRAFLADSDAHKRRKLILALLDRQEYIDFWTYKLGDLFRVNRDLLGAKGMWAFHSWLRQCIAENRGWDRIALAILTASGPANQPGPVGYYRAGRTAEEYSENVSQIFLGIRVQCAKCHNHPFEKWTQSDYFRMANFFARVGRKDDPATGGPVFYSAAAGNVDHPKLGKPLAPTPFDGPQLALESLEDRREFLAAWMVAPGNPYFARNIVNRVWKHYLGRGLVEPADDMRLTNPPTNEPLLEALTVDFIKRGFDLKYLARVILNSATYQAASRSNGPNVEDDRFYSRFFVRRLPAETLLDVICQVTEKPEKFGGIPLGARAVTLPDTRVSSTFLDLFGRPARQVACECERNTEPNVSQALHLINAEDFNKKISANGGVIDRLLAAEMNDRGIIDELYFLCFSRPPSSIETANVLGTLRAATSPGRHTNDLNAARRTVFVDLLWALLSSPEFQFNH